MQMIQYYQESPLLNELTAAYADLELAHDQTKDIISRAKACAGALDATKWSRQIEAAFNDGEKLNELRNRHKNWRIYQAVVAQTLFECQEKIKAARKRMEVALKVAINTQPEFYNHTQFTCEFHKVLANNCLVAAALDRLAAELEENDLRKFRRELPFSPQDNLELLKEAFGELKCALPSHRGSGVIKMVPMIGLCLMESVGGLCLIESVVKDYDYRQFVGKICLKERPACANLREQEKKSELTYLPADQALEFYKNHAKGVVNEKQHADRMVQALYSTKPGEPIEIRGADDILNNQEQRRCDYFSARLALEVAVCKVEETFPAWINALEEAVKETAALWEAYSKDAKSVKAEVLQTAVLDCLIADFRIRRRQQLFQQMKKEAEKDLTDRQSAAEVLARIKVLSETYPPPSGKI